MTCREVFEQLSEYWSDELDEMTRDKVTAHLRDCPSCQREWAIFQSAMNALRSFPAPEPSPELLNRIQSTVMAKRPRMPVFIWRWQWVTAVSVATSFIAFVSVLFFSPMGEKAKFPSPYHIVAEKPEPLPPSLTSRQPLPSLSASPPSIGSQPSPMKQIAKLRRLTTAERQREEAKKAESKQGHTESRKLLPSSPAADLPALVVPSGERLSGQTSKDTPADIAPPAEQTIPKLAELPVEPRILPFRSEARLSERFQSPEAKEIEHMHAQRGPIGPMGQQGLSGPQGPIVAAPPISAQQKPDVETHPPASVGQHFPAIVQQRTQQYGGGLGQASLVIPFTLRWSKFEPVVVGKVRLWQLALISNIPQIVTVFLRMGEKVEVLNAQQPISESKGLVVWRDRVPLGREIFIPILIRANEVGTRKLLLTLETADGKTFSWWCVFPVMVREEQPKIRRFITFQVEQWIVLDLFTHLAWENKVAFLFPEQIAQRIINVPTKAMSMSEILNLLEQQVDGRFVRSGNAIFWIGSVPSVVTPVMKQ